MFDSVLVRFRDAREGTNVLAILMREILKLLDVPESKFQVHRESFDSLVYRHLSLV